MVVALAFDSVARYNRWHRSDNADIASLAELCGRCKRKCRGEQRRLTPSGMRGEGLRLHYSACRFPELAHPVTVRLMKISYLHRSNRARHWKVQSLADGVWNPASLEEFRRIRQKVTSDSKAHFSGVKLDSLSFRCLSNYFTFNQSDCGVWPSPRCSPGRALSLFLS
jgi:hypothetical protein